MSQKLTQTLSFKQQQNLVMTPQMQQAVKLLQMNNIELQAFLEEEMVQNPLLEKQETESESGETEATEDTDQSSDNDDSPPETVHEDAHEDFDAGNKMADVGAGGNSNFTDDLPDFEDRLVRQKTLREHLNEQLHIDADTLLEKSIGTLLIDRLDESGYLRDDAVTLATQIGCSETTIESVLLRLKKFDPTGVFAHDLAECLALQLEEQGELTESFKVLLQNLPLLAQHDYKKLAKVCNVDEDELSEMTALLRTLNPRPSSRFDHVVAQTAIPDVLMKALPKNIGGGWRVELNTDTLPRVLVNQQYYTDVSARTKDKGEREYLTTQLNNASWLVKALEQRAMTILKVASEIVERQDGFFLYGIEFLKPLTLREIAEAIDMHESTVSRVTTGKFIGTPRGLFELKFFFSSSIEGADGTAISSQSVKARIKALTDAETLENILSDDDLVEALNKEGMNVARRTVAKYREALGIQSSVQRRRIKKNAL
ncbi:MAG: RNA polymerase sigma-54 factor [Alphaproteobacteria bacterium RIFCSPHIGHO2_02_FULL_46_13]|nr:MAG: RNA polymerase sigma-54 factor [Alphaproteobacteria bacterium RIFCSPHIGHO2_02_FULL_46_13]